MNFREKIKENIIILDGAMGTILQKRGLLNAGEIPEILNVTRPKEIEKIHREYIEAGSEIIYTNTFGANRKKLPENYDLEKIISAAIQNAKNAAKNTDCLISLDMGPVGEILEPLGSVSFDDAYNIYAEQVKIAENYGVDLYTIETVSDLYEMKAAVLAIKENSNKPIIATMTFEKNFRTFMGCDIRSSAITLEGLGVDVLGINCSLAPDELIPLVEVMMKYTTIPVCIKANAGLPNSDGTFNVDITSFIKSYDRFIELGVNIIGGCCGTTPEYISAFSKYKNLKRKINNNKILSCVCTPSKFVEIDSVKIIGERLNPTGKKLLKQALINKDYDYIMKQALEQIEAGAQILDINCGLPQLDEAKAITDIIKLLQKTIDLPLQIDSSDADTIEKSLRIINGKAIVNSVNGEDKVLDKILPLVKKYGASVIGLTLDEKGIPKTTEERITIAKKIIAKAKSFGIPDRDIFIDPLTLTVSAEQKQARNTLKSIKILSDMGYNTVLGISNISFGLPNRNLLNSYFLMSAMENGLTLPIINPNISENIDAINSFNVISNVDKSCKNYIKEYSNKTINRNEEITKACEQNKNDTNEKKDIEYFIMNGLKNECRKATKEKLCTIEPLEIVNNVFLPALDKVGKLYEEGKIFLPQLILCAETAKIGFSEINEAFSNTSISQKRSKILLATVKGDIHDIGKNIVKVVLENYGYQIFDLGKNVDTKIIIETIKKENIKLVGLSALMTTTAKNMENTITEIRKNNLKCMIMVGGAVITNKYAQEIGADFYAKDANEAVKIAKRVFN